MASFVAQDILPVSVYEQLTDIRVQDPDRSLRIARNRKKPLHLTRDGKLNMLAADHPGRRSVAVGADKMRMADRHDLLARIVRILMSDQVDGIMATMDIIEDLFVLHELSLKNDGPGILEGKRVMTSLNRGGLPGSSWEIDDPVTGPTAATCAQWQLDGIKALLRISDEDPESLKTILACAQAITESNAVGIPFFLEPLPVRKSNGKYKVIKEPEELAGIVSMASALGDSSRYLWLKLPYCEGFDQVADATTLPILLLGGDSTGDDRYLLDVLSGGMKAGSNVRGAMLGRNVLYPEEHDPLGMANATGGIIHKGLSADHAFEILTQPLKPNSPFRS